MSSYRAEASAVVAAPPATVYGTIADYHRGHRAILTARYFTDMTVEEGGQGAGTVARVVMEVFGARATYRLRVTEPEPGRVLRETDDEAGVVTTFTVDPVQGGAASRVTIATEARTAPGVRGLFERLMNPFITRRIYREELAQLARVVANSPGAPGSPGSPQ
jgi:hypothetical protein